MVTLSLLRVTLIATPPSRLVGPNHHEVLPYVDKSQLIVSNPFDSLVLSAPERMAQLLVLPNYILQCEARAYNYICMLLLSDIL